MGKHRKNRGNMGKRGGGEENIEKQGKYRKT